MARDAGMLSLLMLGLLLGMGHAADADHVTAVATIVTRHHGVRRAAWIGAAWGIGHTVTIFIVGGAIIALHLAIPPRFGLLMEFAVGVMLIVLGVRNLSRRQAGEPPAVALARPLVIGVVHGLAGSAAVALLVLAAVPDSRWAAAYLVCFGAGTVAGMMVITTAIAAPVVLAAERVGRWSRMLQRAAGVASIALGVFLAVRIAVFAGLFSQNPQWISR